MADWTRQRYTVVDVEGNGRQPPDLVELGIVPIVGGVIGTPTTWLVSPPRPITPIARRIHGIRNQDVADAPVFADIQADVLRALDGAALVAHNAGVDVGVLRRLLGGWRCPEVFDTLTLARRLLPGRPGYRLGALVDALGLADGLPDGLTPHRAAYDVLVTARLFVHLAAAHSLDELRGQPAEGDADAPAALF